MSMGAVVLVEMLGLQASFVERVDHGGATGAAMIARAARSATVAAGILRRRRQLAGLADK